ncbi:hypothetical protein ASPCAL10088 [Aspergillus calidoustus]|uniref:Zn(2)-C6 fungal-type domain-containing protein n=2 Tax=Aspergillus calidoustus TaxID=454130 RepID=A0A0U5G919_ASPCI|nr:hypothetical protein ASPCAL10088 [Aspergillus calidoustus]
MPPLRSHRKSRTGCLVCRKRRVKCDESGHPCANCTFRGLDCAYADPRTLAGGSAAEERATPSRTESLPGVPPRDSVTRQTQPALSQAAVSLRLQLELMHTYSTETYKSLFAEPTDNHTWQVVVPRRALEDGDGDRENGFLLDGLLSVAALHTAVRLSNSPKPEDRAWKQVYIDVAMEYQSHALQPFQRAIQQISRDNCDVVFAHSLITIVNGIAVPQVLHVSEGRREDSKMNMLETIFTLFELVQGTAEINRITGPWLKDKDPCLVYQDFWAAASGTALDTETDAALNRLGALNDAENKSDITRHLGDGRFTLIEKAISLLRRCFQRYTALNDPVSVLTWLATVDRAFVDCLRRHEALLLLVLMHWGALLARLEGVVWWAGGSGRGLVGDVLWILRVQHEGTSGADKPGRDGGVRRGEDFGGALKWVREDLGL